MSTTQNIRSIEVGDDDELAIVAGSDAGQRTVHVKPEAGRYALVPVDALEPDWDRPDYSDELAVDDATVVSSIELAPGDDSSLQLLKGNQIALRRSTPGVYLTLRLPYEKR